MLTISKKPVVNGISNGMGVATIDKRVSVVADARFTMHTETLLSMEN